MIDSIQSGGLSPTSTIPPGHSEEPGNESLVGAGKPRAHKHDDNQATLALSKEAESKRSADKKATELTPEEEKQVKELKARDAEVRTHEAAHKAAAGGVSVTGPTFEMQRGPDGNNYAVGGSVQIDTSPGSSPEETLQKARSIRRSALAPANPSAQDISVAASASQMEAGALRDLHKESVEEEEEDNEDDAQKDQLFSLIKEPDADNHTASMSHIQNCPECLAKHFSSDSSDSTTRAVATQA